MTYKPPSHAEPSQVASSKLYVDRTTAPLLKKSTTFTNGHVCSETIGNFCGYFTLPEHWSASGTAKEKLAQMQRSLGDKAPKLEFLDSNGRTDVADSGDSVTEKQSVFYIFVPEYSTPPDLGSFKLSPEGPLR